jgi:hypothetical protein
MHCQRRRLPVHSGMQGDFIKECPVVIPPSEISDEEAKNLYQGDLLANETGPLPGRMGCKGVCRLLFQSSWSP